MLLENNISSIILIFFYSEDSPPDVEDSPSVSEDSPPTFTYK